MQQTKFRLNTINLGRQSRFAIFIFAITVLFAAVFAGAVVVKAQDTFEVDVNLVGVTGDALTTCPTITSEERPLDANDIEIFVTNLDSRSDTFDLKLELPPGWSGFPTNFGQLNGWIPTLATGETGKFQILWITVPDVEPGIYTVKANVKSGLTNRIVTKEFRIEVLACHAVAINLVSEGSLETCSETPEAAVYNMEIKNNGKAEETFDLSAVSGRAAVTWADFSSDAVTLGPGETAQVDLTLDPPTDTLGMQNIRINAVSQSSYARDSQDISLNLLNCYDYEASLQPQIATTCLGKPAEYSITITNTGEKEDTYTFSSAPFVDFSEEEIILSTGETKTVNIIATADKEGTTEFDITVTPQNDLSNAQKTTVGLEARDCRGVAVVTSTASLNVCRGDEATASIIIKNTGTLEDTFELSTNIGTLSENKLILQPQELKTIDISIDTKKLEATNTVTITATSEEGVSDQGTIELAIENCYAASLSLSPESQTLCRLQDAEYTVLAKNTGEREDTYTLIFGDQKIDLELEPGESKDFNFVQPVNFETEGDYRIIAALTSDNIDLVAESKLIVKSLEDCYSVGVEAREEAISVEPNKAVTVPVTIKNTGESPSSFELEFEGPPWAYLNPTSIELGPGESKDVYVYLSPPFDTDTGEYDIKVNAKSEFVSSETGFKVMVGGEGTEEGGVVVIEGPEANKTPSGGFLGGLTGALFAGERAPLRLIIVGLIALIIIVILIVRFVMLFK